MSCPLPSPLQRIPPRFLPLSLTPSACLVLSYLTLLFFFPFSSPSLVASAAKSDSTGLFILFFLLSCAHTLRRRLSRAAAHPREHASNLAQLLTCVAPVHRHLSLLLRGYYYYYNYYCPFLLLFLSSESCPILSCLVLYCTAAWIHYSSLIALHPFGISTTKETPPSSTSVRCARSLNRR